MTTSSADRRPGPASGKLLSQRIERGDPAAETEFVEHFRPRILALCTVRTRDPQAAEDITQEVLLGVLEALRRGRLESPKKLAAFVRGAANNRVFAYFKEAQKHRQPTESVRHIAATPEDVFIQNERQRRVRATLSELGEDKRRVIELTLVDGLKPGEIADQLGLRPEVVRKRKSRALRRIKTAMLRESRK